MGYSFLTHQLLPFCGIVIASGLIAFVCMIVRALWSFVWSFFVKPEPKINEKVLIMLGSGKLGNKFARKKMNYWRIFSVVFDRWMQWLILFRWSHEWNFEVDENLIHFVLLPPGLYLHRHGFIQPGEGLSAGNGLAEGDPIPSWGQRVSCHSQN